MTSFDTSGLTSVRTGYKVNHQRCKVNHVRCKVNHQNGWLTFGLNSTTTAGQSQPPKGAKSTTLGAKSTTQMESQPPKVKSQPPKMESQPPKMEKYFLTFIGYFFCTLLEKYFLNLEKNDAPAWYRPSSFFSRGAATPLNPPLDRRTFQYLLGPDEYGRAGYGWGYTDRPSARQSRSWCPLVCTKCNSFSFTQNKFCDSTLLFFFVKEKMKKESSKPQTTSLKEERGKKSLAL